MIPLTTMTAVLATIPLASEVPDPADVKPGWLGFGVFLLLAAAVVVLWFSFRKQLRKVNFEESGGAGASQQADAGNGEAGTGEEQGDGDSGEDR